MKPKHPMQMLYLNHHYSFEFAQHDFSGAKANRLILSEASTASFFLDATWLGVME